MGEKCDVRLPWNVTGGLYSLCEAFLPPPGSHVYSTSAHLIIPPTSVKNPEACRAWGGAFQSPRTTHGSWRALRRLPRRLRRTNLGPARPIMQIP
eukprot:9304046-Pyramimonas_sp.AAC.1